MRTAHAQDVRRRRRRRTLQITPSQSKMKISTSSSSCSFGSVNFNTLAFKEVVVVDDAKVRRAATVVDVGVDLETNAVAL